MHGLSDFIWFVQLRFTKLKVQLALVRIPFTCICVYRNTYSMVIRTVNIFQSLTMQGILGVNKLICSANVHKLAFFFDLIPCPRFVPKFVRCLDVIMAPSLSCFNSRLNAHWEDNPYKFTP